MAAAREEYEKKKEETAKGDRYNAEIRPICDGSLLTANVTTVCLSPSLRSECVNYKNP